MLGEREARQRFERLLTADVSSLTLHGARGLASEVAKLRSFLDRIDVDIARRVRALATSPASATPTDVLDDHGRRARSEARAAEERARACDEVAGFDQALATGAVSAGHVDAIARATKDLDASAKQHVAELANALIAHAATESIRDFDRRCKNLVRRLTDQRGAEARSARQREQSTVRTWVDKNTGMWHTRAELDPERGAKLAAALQSHLESIQQRDGNAGVDIDRLRADALCELVTLSSGKIDKRVPEVHVHVDWTTLLHGAHEHSLCELTDGSAIPVSTLRRLCCEAIVVPILLGPDGMPIDCGREVRTANRKQRRVLRNMYRTCGIGNCDVPFDLCHIHHITSWLDNGDTNLDNLIPLCNHHHHLVHEGRWTLTMTARTRVVTVHTPDGRTWFTGTTHDRPVRTDDHRQHSGTPPDTRSPAA